MDKSIITPKNISLFAFCVIVVVTQFIIGGSFFWSGLIGLFVLTFGTLWMMFGGQELGDQIKNWWNKPIS